MRALIRTIGITLISSAVIIILSFMTGASITQVIAVILKYGITALIIFLMLGFGVYLADDAEKIAKEFEDNRRARIMKKEKLLEDKQRLFAIREAEADRILKNEGINI